MLQIEIVNEQTSVPVDTAPLRRVAEGALRCEGVDEAELSVILLDNETIHRWNRQTFEHDFPTDVITFRLDDPEFPGAGELLEGELLISAEMAAQLAGEVGWSVQEECSLYLIHGILHLTGYDDQNAADQRIMRKREREILETLGMKPGPRDDRWD